LRGQVAEAVKEERLAALQDVLKRQQKDFNRACLGKTLPVLVENPSRRAGGVWGKSPFMQSMHVTGGVDFVGRVINVRVTRATLGGLYGEVVA
jgi:tRNA-2-methylthio-N6-dimethylallyladenosine synthase